MGKLHESAIFEPQRLKSSKKAQSISINTIVVAAIALIVLVVIIAIFGGKIRDFGKGTKSCQGQGGVGCYEGCGYEEYLEGAGHKQGIYTSIPGTDCQDQVPPLKCCTLVIPTGE